MNARQLLPFLLISFGLAWSLVALLILFPETVTSLFGELRASNPLFILAVYSPAIAAFILVIHHAGISGLRRFLSRLLLWRVHWAWYALLLIGIPLIYYTGAALKGNLPIESLPFESAIGLLAALAFMLVLGPVEEFGWRGLALPLLQQRLLPFWAGLILGAIWGVWHLPAFFLSGTPQSAWSFFPFFIGAIAVGIIVTPLFNASGGSILLPVLFHWQLNNPVFPDAAPHDTLVFVGVAVIVVILNRKALFGRETAVTCVVPGENGSAWSEDS